METNLSKVIGLKWMMAYLCVWNVFQKEKKKINKNAHSMAPHWRKKKKMCAKFHGENWNIFFIAWIKGNNLNHFTIFFFCLRGFESKLFFTLLLSPYVYLPVWIITLATKYVHIFTMIHESFLVNSTDRKLYLGISFCHRGTQIQSYFFLSKSLTAASF